MKKCNNDCSRCYLRNKSLCPNKPVVLNHEAFKQIFYEGWQTPEEDMNVLNEFIKGVENE